MFARVITAHAGQGDLEKVVDLADRQLPGARARPGFAGFYLLVDDRAGTVVTISLWETREDMEAVSAGTADGVHDEGASEAGLRDLRLDTYEVPVHASAG